MVEVLIMELRIQKYHSNRGKKPKIYREKFELKIALRFSLKG